MNEERKKRGERIEGMKKHRYQNTFVYEKAKVDEVALALCGLLE
jgi:hypothetical protein